MKMTKHKMTKNETSIKVKTENIFFFKSKSQ